MAIGFGFATYGMASEGEWRLLPILIWAVFVVWQVMPILLVSFKQQFDLNILLRFPVRFRSYLALTMLFGISDLSTIFGVLSLFGIWLGLVTVNFALALPCGVVPAVHGIQHSAGAHNFCMDRPLAGAAQDARDSFGDIFSLHPEHAIVQPGLVYERPELDGAWHARLQPCGVALDTHGRALPALVAARRCGQCCASWRSGWRKCRTVCAVVGPAPCILAGCCCAFDFAFARGVPR